MVVNLAILHRNVYSNFTTLPNATFLYIITVLSVLTLLRVWFHIRSPRCHKPDLSAIPGPWYTSISHAWFFYQRWHGRLAPASHAILLSHGDETNGIVRLSPTVVLLNDWASLKALFGQQGSATGTKVVRALNLGGHAWSIMVPEFDLVRGRRQAVQAATVEAALQQWQPRLEQEVRALLDVLGSAGRAVDVVKPLRVLTVRASALALTGTEISDATTRHILETNSLFNRCVANRLCMPDRLVSALDMLPTEGHLLSRTSLFRTLGSGAKLFGIGKQLNKLAAAAIVPTVPTVPKAPTAAAAAQSSSRNSSIPVHSSAFHRQREQMQQASGAEDSDLLSADTAGGLLAGSETTAATLAWILYELSRRPGLVEQLRSQAGAVAGGPDLLDAVIKEELRYRGPVALTSNRIVGASGASVLGGRYLLPAGTVVVMHNHSLSRREPRGSSHGVWDPARWLDGGGRPAGSGDRCSAPFGVGVRRCPGKGMAWMIMRMVIAAVVREFVLQCPPETTDKTMGVVELNGNRPRKEECRLVFVARRR